VDALIRIIPAGDHSCGNPLMKGEGKIISFLDEYLSIELTGHKQYLLHSCVCQNWGLQRLAEKQKAYSVEETEHAFEIAKRLLFLEGTPGLADARSIQVKSSVEEQLALDRDLIGHAIGRLRAAIAQCIEQKDGVTRDLFERMLVDEEEHLHWIESQLGLIAQVGAQKYLQSQM
jgi:bacterioferritin